MSNHSPSRAGTSYKEEDLESYANTTIVLWGSGPGHNVESSTIERLFLSHDVCFVLPWYEGDVKHWFAVLTPEGFRKHDFREFLGGFQTRRVTSQHRGLVDALRHHFSRTGEVTKRLSASGSSHSPISLQASFSQPHNSTLPSSSSSLPRQQSSTPGRTSSREPATRSLDGRSLASPTSEDNSKKRPASDETPCNIVAKRQATVNKSVLSSYADISTQTLYEVDRSSALSKVDMVVVTEDVTSGPTVEEFKIVWDDLENAVTRVKELEQEKEEATQTTFIHETVISGLQRKSQMDEGKLGEIEKALDVRESEIKSAHAQLVTMQELCKSLAAERDELKRERDSLKVRSSRLEAMAPTVAQACQELETLANHILHRHKR